MKSIAIIILFIGNISLVKAQRVLYSEAEKEDVRNMNFEIIGKFGDKIVVYKNFRSDNYLSIFNAVDMKLANKVKLKNMPNKLINVDFVVYPNYFYMIYQYQKKNIINCEAIKLDGNAIAIGEPQLLDTTSIPFYVNDNKIYSIVVSENKQQIAVVKGNKKNDRNHNIGIVKFDANLKKIKKNFYTIAMDGRNNYLDEFTIDNESNIYMAKCYANNGSEYVTKFDVLHIANNTDTITTFPIVNGDKILDEIKFKMDNANNRLITQTFYFTKRKGNVEGICVAFWDKNTKQIKPPVFTKFSDSFRIEVNGVNNLKLAFNDFYINNTIIKKDGSFITNTECYFSTIRGGGALPLTRWDYFTSTPYITNYDYYDMGGRYNTWNNWDRGNTNTYNAENIAIMSFDKNGNLDWSNVVHKSQKDDGLEDFISYQTILTGGAIHFLFNDKDRNDYLLTDNSVSPSGQVTRHPTLKNLNRQYQLTPRYGKQISAKEIVFPCIYKNYICFAKLEYN